MRTLVGIVLCLTLLLLAAPAPAALQTTITFWSHTHPPMVDLYKKLVAEYERANPSVHIEYTVIPNNQFFAKVLTSMSTGTGPDVMNMSSSQVFSYIDNNRVVPVDPTAFGVKTQQELEAIWRSGVFAGISKGGKIYGIPSEYNVAVLVVNADHFKAAGLNPADPIETLDDLVRIAEKLTVRQGNRIIRRGFDFPYLQNFYTNTFQILLFQAGGSILNAAGTESVINSPAGVRALSFWRDIIQTYRIGGPQYSPRDATNPMQDYASGEVSMFIAYPWTLGAIEPGSAVYRATRVKLLPQFDPSHPSTIAYAYYWMVNRESRNQTEGWKFINFLSSQPTQWLKEVGFIQPRKGWDTTPEARQFPFINVWLQAMGQSQFILQHPRAAEIGQAIIRAIERTVLNNADPKTSLDQAKREIDEVLRQK